MADKNFAERISKLLNENGYSRGYGTQNMPVSNAEWPSSENPNGLESQDSVPDGSQQTTVTNGDTTVIGEPRDDLAAQDGSDFDPNTMTEVGSLLITIGFILANSGHVSDKYDTPAVLEFLQTHFKVVAPTGEDQMVGNKVPVVSAEVSTEVIPVVSAEVTSDVDAPVELTKEQKVKYHLTKAQEYMTERKLIDAKLKKTS